MLVQSFIICRPVKSLFHYDKQIYHTLDFNSTLGSKKWFDLDLWTCDLKINRVHLLMGRNPCTMFGIDQVKRSKDIELTTHWAEKSGLSLSLTFFKGGIKMWPKKTNKQCYWLWLYTWSLYKNFDNFINLSPRRAWLDVSYLP